MDSLNEKSRKLNCRSNRIKNFDYFEYLEGYWFMLNQNRNNIFTFKKPKIFREYLEENCARQGTLIKK